MNTSITEVKQPDHLSLPAGINAAQWQAAQSCRADIAPAFSDWHYALRGLPAEQVSSVLGVLSFYQRVNAIALRASERALALTQLQWWQTQVDSENDDAGTHPCLQALGSLRQQAGIRTRMQRLIALAIEDVDFAGFASNADMQRFFRTRGALLVELLALVQQKTIAPEAAANWGYFLEYAALLAHLPRQFSHGLIYFSAERLAEHTLTAEDLANDARARQADLQQLLKTESELARAALAKLPRASKSALPFLQRYSALQLAWLNASAADGYRLFEHQLALGSLQKRLLCWRVNWFGV